MFCMEERAKNFLLSPLPFSQNLHSWSDDFWKHNELVLSNFFFCHYVFKKLSAAKVSESIYMRERDIRFSLVISNSPFLIALYCVKFMTLVLRASLKTNRATLPQMYSSLLVMAYQFVIAYFLGDHFEWKINKQYLILAIFLKGHEDQTTSLLLNPIL